MDEVRQTSNLIVATTSLSTQNEIWSQLFLLFLQDSPPKPKIKKLAKAPTTPPETPPESPTLTYTTAPADTTAHRRGDHLLRDGTSSSSSSHQSKNRELSRMKVSWVRLSGDATFPEPVTPVSRQCHAMASFSICHAIFIGHHHCFSIVSDVLYICLLTDVFSFSIFLRSFLMWSLTAEILSSKLTVNQAGSWILTISSISQGRCVLLSLNLLILNLFCWNQSIATWVGSIYKVNYIQFCKSVGETLVYSVQMKNTVNCCSHGNVLMCSTRCSISRRNRVLRGGGYRKGGSHSNTTEP